MQVLTCFRLKSTCKFSSGQQWSHICCVHGTRKPLCVNGRLVNGAFGLFSLLVSTMSVTSYPSCKLLEAYEDATRPLWLVSFPTFRVPLECNTRIRTPHKTTAPKRWERIRS
eukprot:2624520-Amphidinium_carterae.1